MTEKLTKDQHTYQQLLEFFSKHAIGGKLPPSCIVCGQVCDKPAISHAELASIVVCFSCRNAAQRTRSVEQPPSNQRVFPEGSIERELEENAALKGRIDARIAKGQRPSSNLVVELRSIAQNDYMIDQHYLPAGHVLNDAADELERFRTGYQGSCYCCEPVGIENQRLCAALENIVATESVDDDGEPVPETGACFLARLALRGAVETAAVQFKASTLPRTGNCSCMVNSQTCMIHGDIR